MDETLITDANAAVAAAMAETDEQQVKMQEQIPPLQQPTQNGSTTPAPAPSAMHQVATAAVPTPAPALASQPTMAVAQQPHGLNATLLSPTVSQPLAHAMQSPTPVALSQNPAAAPASATTATPRPVAAITIPVHPVTGLPLDVRAKPDGNGTDREWLELTKAKPSGAQSNQPPVIVDDGNLLVGLIGGRDESHTALLNNVSHAFPLRIISYKSNYNLPKSKGARITYDGYQPQGMIKSHWIVKHKYLLPAVICLVTDWDESKSFEVQEQQLLTRTLKLKQELQGRETRILSVIVKSGKFGSNEEENMFVSRLTQSLRVRIGLEYQHRTVAMLVVADIQATTKRLEASLAEIAADYYRAEIKRLRNLVTRINVNMQPSLYIRHQLKIGYYSECIRDAGSAIKAYGNSYTALINYVSQFSAAQFQSLLAHEVKQVSLILNYRLCRLFLGQQRYTDALDQFHTHIAIMQKCVGLGDCMFHHYQWLSQQHHLMGDLLESVPVHARNKQFNSGYFYQTAANYAMKRKQYATIVLNKSKAGTLPTIVPPATLAPSPFLGQARLPHSVELSRDDRAVPGVMAFYVSNTPEDLVRSLLSFESPVDHSSQVIGLLNKSYQSYKRESSDRMIVHVASQIATEYFVAKNWEMAQQFFDRIATTYRQEMWFTILTATLMTVYHCAQQMTKDKDIINYSLELLSNYATTTTEQKENIHRHLIELLSKFDSSQSSTMLGSVYELPHKYKIIDVDAHFLTTSSGVVYVKQPVDLSVTLDFRFPLPVYCTSIVLQFNHSGYSLTLAPSDSDTTSGAGDAIEVSDTSSVRVNTLFQPHQPKTFRLRFIAHTATAESDIVTLDEDGQAQTLAGLTLTHVLAHVLLEPGMAADRALSLRSQVSRVSDDSHNALKSVYQNASADSEYNKHNRKHKVKDRRTQEEKDTEARVKCEEEERQRAALTTRLHSVPIVPPHPAAVLTVDQPTPPLLNEFYPIKLVISSHQDRVNHGTIELSVIGNTGASESVDSEANKENQSGNVNGTETSSVPTGKGTKQSRSDVPLFYVRANNGSTGLTEADMLQLTEALTVPSLAPRSTHTVTVYARFATPTTQHLHIRLHYSNQDNFKLRKSLDLSVLPRAPLFVKYKVFSDGLHSVNPKVFVDTPHPLPLNALTAMHIEIDNISPHALALTGIRFELPASLTTMSDSGSVSDSESGGEDASERFHERHATNPAILGSVSGKSKPVLLAPGERYLHLVYFTPTALGTIASPSMLIDWCRVLVHKKAKELDDYNGSLNEKQRDDLLKKLIAEQRVRAGGEQKSGGLLSAEQRAASPSPPIVEKEEDSASPVDALQRELADAEAEAKARNEERKQAELNTEQVTIKKLPNSSSTLTSALSVSSENANDSLSLPWLPVLFNTALPTFTVTAPSVELLIDFPPIVEFGTTFNLVFTLINHSQSVQQLDFTLLADSDGVQRFVMSGDRSGTLRLLPQDRWPCVLKCAPLDVGFLPMPRFQFQLHDGTNVGDANEYGYVFVQTPSA